MAPVVLPIMLATEMVLGAAEIVLVPSDAWEGEYITVQTDSGTQHNIQVPQVYLQIIKIKFTNI